jgi:cation transporter-like permease
MDAFRLAMLISAGLALCGAAVAAFGISDTEARRRCGPDEVVQPTPAR